MNSEGEVTVGQTDPEELKAMRRQATALLAEITEKELRHLEREYPLGFILIASSGEVQGSVARAHTDRIRGNWDDCVTYIDNQGRARVRLSELYIKGGAHSLIDVARIDIIPPGPGMEPRGFVCPEVTVLFEALRTKSDGVCIVVGFKETDASQRL